jgi:phenylacetate-CoA ligase
MHAPGSHDTRLSARLLWSTNTLKDRLLNIHAISTSDVSEEALAGWAERVRVLRPRVVYGYGTSIHLFARYLRGNSQARAHGVDAVIVTGEKISSRQKAEIRQAFGSTVVEEYGSSECGIIAFECPQGRLHTSDESIVVEELDAVADGSGELLVTPLTNDLMPLIRYRIGDTGALSTETCPCGRALGVVKEVFGRVIDFLVRSNGDRLEPTPLMRLLERIEKIARYRIEQPSVGTIELTAQTDDALDEVEVATIRSAFREALGADTEVRIQFVDSIAQSQGGKHRFIRSLAGDWSVQAAGGGAS